MIDGFIFDMDGVLFDTENISKRCHRMVSNVFGIADKIDYLFENTVGLNKAATKELYMSVLGEDFPYDDYRFKYNEVVNKIISDEGLPVKTGAYMLLEYLKANRYKVALATSTSKTSVYSHLETSKMESYFSAIITGDMIENGKPAPDIYLEACRQLNIKPENGVAIEDSPNGLKSARAAGMKTVMVVDLIPYTEELAPYVDMKLNSLSDMLELLIKGEMFAD